jgi:hypothetical protein
MTSHFDGMKKLNNYKVVQYYNLSDVKLCDNLKCTFWFITISLQMIYSWRMFQMRFKTRVEVTRSHNIFFSLEFIFDKDYSNNCKYSESRLMWSMLNVISHLK